MNHDFLASTDEWSEEAFTEETEFCEVIFPEEEGLCEEEEFREEEEFHEEEGFREEEGFHTEADNNQVKAKRNK